MARLGLVLMVVVITGLQLTSQALTFEVVSVKENPNGAGVMTGMRPRPDGSIAATRITLGILLAMAFPASTEGPLGLPDWAASARFDVSAKAPAGVGNVSPEQHRAMMQALLADRFKLKTHYEKREVPAYDLVMARSDAKLGPQLTPSDIDCATASPTDRPSVCSRRLPTLTRIDGLMTMESLAMALGGKVGRVVVDKTGLKGYYTLVLETTPGLGTAPAAAATSDLPSVFTAVQEQLGLRLVSSRAPVEVLVIDHIERPSEN